MGDGKHTDVKHFMKGIFQSRPPLPCYSKTWDVNLVLQYIGSIKASHVSSFDHSSEKRVNSPFRYYRRGLRGNKVYFPA